MKLLTPNEGWQLLEREIQPLGPELTPVDRASGRVLAREVVATTSIPAWDVAALDGWAVSGDPAVASTLPLGGGVRAGDPPGIPLPAGQVLRIATGAPIPQGADRVLPVELGSEAGALVRVIQTVPKGHAIRREGEVCRAGDVILPSGARLNPAALGLLAAQGTTSVWTFRQPRIALVVTGTEVVAPGEVPPPGKLRDAHSIALQAEAQKRGFQLQFLGRAPDEPDRLRELFGRGLEFDVLLTTGGVSKGTHDLVEPVFHELGVEARITGLAIQPGKPFFAGRSATGNWILGLPGNPVSALVLFTLFVLPVLDRLQGGCLKFWSEAQRASAAVELAAGKERELFLPARFEDGWVTPLPLKGSHDLVTFARANSLLRRPIHAPSVPAGEAVEVLRL